MRERSERGRVILLTCKLFAPNAKAREKARETIALYETAFGKPSLVMRIMSLGVLVFAAIEAAKIRLNKLLTGREFIAYQPSMRRTYYW
jgi:hypothetical protein